MANLLVIGTGGREHAICWKLQQSKNVSTIYAHPGSHGINQLEKTKIVTELSLKDFQVRYVISQCIVCTTMPPPHTQTIIIHDACLLSEFV
jgi:phosphoribosylamine-glycine ligase